MKTFHEWAKLFNDQNLEDFTIYMDGIYWLKIKSIIRRDIVNNFISKNSLTISSSSLNDIFIELYDKYSHGIITNEMIDNFLTSYNRKEIEDISNKFDLISTELYKLQHFEWGGDIANSLDKQIVSYIKSTFRYDDILQKIDNEIYDNTKRYTLTSWYNNWTTILTEHLFKKSNMVISAIGKVKSVDFFIDNIPLDLKITYFPKKLIDEQRKNNDLKSEITELKHIARQYNINFDNNATQETIKYQIIEQIKDSGNRGAINSLNTLTNENNNIINNIVQNKMYLIKWLYENQGELRFGSENRLFMVLIDTQNQNDSWKLKRNFGLLKNSIDSYLSTFDRDNLLNNKINFNFKGRQYSTIADCLIVKA
ncbi:hypothetical protein [Desulfovibrio sp. ZJ200]|uniref:hypothetical protein n=1 Tax=Desulfovibrio sp. ZJ200 TaxID=2709792 RepID=UPI0013EA1F7E|nr:hypothetical protein [Desulfovibrio sp. ZJ200]